MQGAESLRSSSCLPGRELPGLRLLLMLTNFLSCSGGKWVGQRGGRPSLSIIPTGSCLARLPSLRQAIPSLEAAGLKRGTQLPYLSRLARLSFQFGEEEGNNYLHTIAMCVQSFQSSTNAKMCDRTFYRVMEKQRFMDNEHSVISLRLILVSNDLILPMLSAY